MLPPNSPFVPAKVAGEDRDFAPSSKGRVKERFPVKTPRQIALFDRARIGIELFYSL